MFDQYLMRGDCLDLMPTIADNSVDLILCDLPYGTTACTWDSVIPFEPLWEQYLRISRGAIVLTASQPFTTALIASNLKDFRYCWIWEKEQGTGFGNSKRMPLKSHEDIAVFYKNQPTYNPQGLIPKRQVRKHTHSDVGRALGVNGLHGKEFMQEFANWPKSVIRCQRDPVKIHPTQKPVALMEYLIRTYTNEGDTVLDNCMGSGTTGIACANTDRKFIGIERDEKYFDICCERIGNLSRVGDIAFR